MSRFLRREKARACPIHNAVLDEAARRLEHEGVFSKEEILESLRFGAVADAIRWDYVREFLQDTQGCELVPLSFNYFKRHRRAEELVNPSRFIASGHGKRTAGYAAVSEHNDHLVVKRVQHRKSMANGAGEAFKEYLRQVEVKRGKPIPFKEAPQIESDHELAEAS